MESGLRIGSLCSGYGGLDIAVLAVFGGELAWCADNDKHVSTILAARYTSTPNLGDLTALDWAEVPTVDILCAGFPCQDISFSGRGAGIEKGVRSGIWKYIVRGIRELRPKLIIVENVAAIRSRGLNRVLGDLATLGYDASWTSIRASDIGAAHRRERVFILAYQPDAKDVLAAAHARGQRWQWRPAYGQAPSRWPSGGPVRPGDICMGVTDWRRPPATRTSISSVGEIAWQEYEAAIRRWEALTGRTAPYPVERGTRGQPRLATAFSEWLMGLPSGFVTALGLPYSAQHRALGNGVVPQQAVAALWQLVAMATGQEAEDNTIHERGLAA
jgi:DNA (cytosine-5)-methyltransferase 1